MDKIQNKVEQKRLDKTTSKRSTEAAAEAGKTPVKSLEEAWSDLAGFRACLITSRGFVGLAILETQMTLSLGAEGWLSQEATSAVKTIETFFVTKLKQLGDAITDWNALKETAVENYLTMEEDTVLSLPEEERDFALQVRDSESEFYKNLYLAGIWLREQERRARQYCRILFRVRWREEHAIPSLLECASELPSVSVESPEVIDMKRLLLRKSQTKI
ncbi:hypothetical protein ACFL2Q_02745 [Thermodesulfobacteriota bacterium]